MLLAHAHIKQAQNLVNMVNVFHPILSKSCGNNSPVQILMPPKPSVENNSEGILLPQTTLDINRFKKQRFCHRLITRSGI